MWQKAAAARRQSGKQLPIGLNLNSLVSVPHSQENDNQSPRWSPVENHMLFDKERDSRTMAVCQTL
jgi:hypothetical protein